MGIVWILIKSFQTTVMQSKLIVTIGLLLFSLVSFCQDIIIKRDKTEMKTRVIEIGDDKIKYKKWELQDGPLYSISKAEVFMIIYANGQRELINQQEPPALPVAQPVTLQSTNNGIVNPLTEPGLDTTVDYKSIRIKYSPSRIYASISSPFTLGVDQEIRLIKNVLNLGTTYEASFGEGFTTNTYGAWLSGYVPVNRLMKNYENQDKGLFVFAKAGYLYNSTTFNNGFESETISSGGFSWRLGMDYLISKHFGLSVLTYKFSSFRAGIVFSFL
jgi:hypothetical protein